MEKTCVRDNGLILGTTQSSLVLLVYRSTSSSASSVRVTSEIRNLGTPR